MHLVTKLIFTAKWFKSKKLTLLAELTYKLYRIIFSCDIHYSVDMDKSIKLYHNGLGVVIHRKAKLGKNVSIYQNVTIGGNGKTEHLNGSPVIGDNVIIGAGAVVLGPVTIGDYVKIGANAVVNIDIGQYSTAVGVPAVEIKRFDPGNL
ncbi:serine O-acetyltransferase [Vibrio natriegens]|uniref:serine O-acetyltransferase n=1 Tax=Vibrio natriegens TaxID=691 RepID=UPI00080453A9|nr:DapH/DapD/GlmU-related protein [Vibrio natriegens]ANQ15910.1 hypothetical protein BA891_01145 [Vibrio natriegens]